MEFEEEKHPIKNRATIRDQKAGVKDCKIDREEENELLGGGIEFKTVEVRSMDMMKEK